MPVPVTSPSRRHDCLVHAELRRAVFGEQADLLEAALVHQPRHTFACGQLAGGPLGLVALFAATGLGLGTLAAQLGKTLGHGPELVSHCLTPALCSPGPSQHRPAAHAGHQGLVRVAQGQLDDANASIRGHGPIVPRSATVSASGPSRGLVRRRP